MKQPRSKNAVAFIERDAAILCNTRLFLGRRRNDKIRRRKTKRPSSPAGALFPGNAQKASRHPFRENPVTSAIDYCCDKMDLLFATEL